MKAPKCPKCGSPMIRRIAGRGSHKGKAFYGCSNYPRCKLIVDIPNQEQPVAKPHQEESPKESEPKHETLAPENEQSKTPLTEKQIFILKNLRDQLLNISTNNRSVRLNHLYDIWAFDLHSLIEPFGSDHVNRIIESALQRKPKINLLPLNSKEEKVNRLSNRLQKLFRNVKEIEVEKGLYDLNIGFSFLCGLTTQGKVVQGPILLMPARLERSLPKRGTPQWVITQEKGVPATFNKTLLMALSKYNANTINNDIYEMEIPEELYGKENFMEWVCATLNQYGVPCYLAEDAHDADIDKLPEYNVDDLPATFQPGKLTVHQCAVLGHFPQANSSILNDYEYFLGASQEDIDNLLPIIDTEISTEASETRTYVSDEDVAGESEDDSAPRCLDSIPEKKNVFLLQADGSQEKIILSLYDKTSPGVVVWGPPGTGKSQTIVNLIGHALGQGLTCLVVCQKRAALDVVHDRLDSLGLSKHIAVVHDSRKDRKDLYTKLEEHTVVHDDPPISSRSYEELSATIDKQTVELNSVYKTLYEPTPRKITPIQLYRNTIPTVVSGFILPSTCSELDVESLAELLNGLQEYQQVACKLTPNCPWRHRKSFHELGPMDMKILAADAQNLLTQQDEFALNSDIVVQFAGWQKSKSMGTEFAPASPSEFTRILSAHLADKSILRFFTERYWRRRFAIAKYRGTAQASLRQFAADTRHTFDRFLGEDELSSMCREASTGNAVFDSISALRESLLADFDSLVAADRLYQSASACTRDCIDQLQVLRQEGVINASQEWPAIVKSMVHDTWIDEIEKASDVPNKINTGAVDATISTYRTNILDKYARTANWLASHLRIQTYFAANLPLLRKLRGYVAKKRNIPSIRKLNDELLSHGYHNITTPCWLVSPETVSDVFPQEKGLFDIVIFDEASQCPVKNALPAVFRGKKVFVAGDEKQLPPLTLFESAHQEGYEENNHKDIDALDAQSFLNLANRLPRYKELPLSWHYRSEHEELIAYSNHAFYNGLMRTCPNCKPYNAEAAPAISWYSANGYWIDRSNEVEADYVVDYIRTHLSEHPNASIGVITFNAEQKTQILNKIDNMCQIDSLFKDLIGENSQRKLDEQLFVKNIENVQGDERDTIVFSVAYAPSEPGGKVIQQFGLLNQDGGENRLNVAVSRARQHVHVVCSIDPELDMNTTNSKYLGPKRLQQYLIYAKAVAQRDQTRVLALLSELNPSMKVSHASGTLSFDSPFEEEVYNGLRRKGYDVHAQVGQSGFRIDLCVVHPQDSSRYILGIECDGAKYHSSQSARDRDVFRQKFLERRGWVLYRVWSTKWWRNKDRELDNLSTYIEGLVN